MTDYDVIVLGGGPGGYASALYGASAGLSIAHPSLSEAIGETMITFTGRSLHG